MGNAITKKKLRNEKLFKKNKLFEPITFLINLKITYLHSIIKQRLICFKILQY